MERTLTIDGRPVVFRATAAVPRLYRMEYGRDIMQDMLELQTAIDAAQGGRGPIPPRLLSIFEDMSYLMAKHARPDEVTATSSEEWLDGFDTFSVYQVFPAIAQLWQANLKTTSTPKKNEADGKDADHRPILPPGPPAGPHQRRPGAHDGGHGHRPHHRGGQRQGALL